MEGGSAACLRSWAANCHLRLRGIAVAALELTHLWLPHVVNDAAPGRHNRAVVTRAVFMSIPVARVEGGGKGEGGTGDTSERDCYQLMN